MIRVELMTTEPVTKHDADLNEMRVGMYVTRDYQKPTEGAWKVTHAHTDDGPFGGTVVVLERAGRQLWVTDDTRDLFDLKIADNYEGPR
jgi:hypothetical protein